MFSERYFRSSTPHEYSPFTLSHCSSICDPGIGLGPCSAQSGVGRSPTGWRSDRHLQRRLRWAGMPYRHSRGARLGHESHARYLDLFATHSGGFLILHARCNQFDDFLSIRRRPDNYRPRKRRQSLFGFPEHAWTRAYFDGARRSDLGMDLSTTTSVTQNRTVEPERFRPPSSARSWLSGRSL